MTPFKEQFLAGKPELERIVPNASMGTVFIIAFLYPVSWKTMV